LRFKVKFNYLRKISPNKEV